MTFPGSQKEGCRYCLKITQEMIDTDAAVCPECAIRAEALFDEEMRRIELIRLIRGTDVELYDLKHPDSTADANHCGQVILIKAGSGFEIKIFLKSTALEWQARLGSDDFISDDTRLDALIGNISLLLESWGGGPHYMDILYIERVLNVESEL